MRALAKRRVPERTNYGGPHRLPDVIRIVTVLRDVVSLIRHAPHFHRSRNSLRRRAIAGDAAGRAARRALDRPGKLPPDAALHRRHRRQPGARDRRHAQRRAAHVVRVAPRRPHLVRRTQAARRGRDRGADAGPARAAGRAGAHDAARRARARGTQIHPARLARTAARHVESRGSDYLSTRQPFRSAPFQVGRFVLFSSRASVGGGPYVVEAAYPLKAREAGPLQAGPIPA